MEKVKETFCDTLLAEQQLSTDSKLFDFSVTSSTYDNHLIVQTILEWAINIEILYDAAFVNIITVESY